MITTNPDIMVIGDSLAQGCRSLTVNQEFSSQCYGARIAQVGRVPFTTPDFARPILFDLEQEVRQVDFGLGVLDAGVVFEGFTQRFRSNLQDWLANRKESDAATFENIALAGCKVGDLMDRTAQTSSIQIAQLTPNGANSDILKLDLGDLHLAINGRFTLNPSQDPAYAGYSPMDWVRVREPKRLIIHVGHNHGLYSVGGDGLNVSITQGNFWADFQRLAEQVALLPDTVGQIIVVLLPKVGSVANLAPVGTQRDPQGYAASYDPVLSTSPSSLSASELEAIDQTIESTNDSIAQLFKTAAGAKAGRYVFVSTYALLQDIDYKNSLDPKKLIPVGASTYSNEYLQGTSVALPAVPGQGRSVRYATRVIHGGFQSIDGMHATGLGYAVLAARIMDAIGWTYDQNALYTQAFNEDALLSQYPGQLDGVTGLLKMVRDFRRLDKLPQHTSTVATTQTPSNLEETLSIMKSALADRAYGN